MPFGSTTGFVEQAQRKPQTVTNANTRTVGQPAFWQHDGSSIDGKGLMAQTDNTDAVCRPACQSAHPQNGGDSGQIPAASCQPTGFGVCNVGVCPPSCAREINSYGLEIF